jgi:hypothetical protein
MTPKTGQRVQKSWDQECWGRTGRKGQLGNDSWNRTTGAGKPGQDSLDRTAETGQRRRQSRWYGQNRKGKIRQQYSMTEGQDSWETFWDGTTEAGQT